LVIMVKLSRLEIVWPVWPKHDAFLRRFTARRCDVRV